MVILRGEVWWADLGSPHGSAPAFRRPVVVVSADFLNRSTVQTVSVVGLTSNTRWAGLPGSVLVPSGSAGLDRDSVANVTQLQTIDKGDLEERVGRLPVPLVREIDHGLRLALDL